MTYNQELDTLPAWVQATIPAEYQQEDDVYLLTEAIEAVRAGDTERIITWGVDTLDCLRARQIVALYDLGGFVTERVTA